MPRDLYEPVGVVTTDRGTSTRSSTRCARGFEHHRREHHLGYAAAAENRRPGCRAGRCHGRHRRAQFLEHRRALADVWPEHCPRTHHIESVDELRARPFRGLRLRGRDSRRLDAGGPDSGGRSWASCEVLEPCSICTWPHRDRARGPVRWRRLRRARHNHTGRDGRLMRPSRGRSSGAYRGGDGRVSSTMRGSSAAVGRASTRRPLRDVVDWR